MGHSERPLARIAQTVEETADAMAAAAVGGAVPLAEWRSAQRRLRVIGGLLARHDLEDAYGLTVARNGYHTQRAARLRRQIVALPPIEDDAAEPGAPRLRAA